jgi:hypothetical protein
MEDPMTVWDIVIPAVALAVGVGVTVVITRRRRRDAEPPAARSKILFPFVGTELSERALQATIRLAWAEDAVVVPGYLTTVPQSLPLDVPVGRSCDEAFSVFEAIEQRAAKVGVQVDGRIARGRNVRHALRVLMSEVPAATRIVVAAASGDRHDGFGVDDIAWLLRNARGEVLVVRPDPEAGAAPLRQPQDDPLLHARSAA